ncbi:MAG TPA: cytochrome c oxidase subunit 3, partial [Candidatus Thermoplasmatota archaeon]
MSSAKSAHTTPMSAHAGEDEEMVHHLSPWPIIAALGGTLLAVGIVTHPVVLFIGVIGTLAGLAGWVREDMHFYNHPMPALFHHGKAPNPLWGVILFLGTEVVLFGALFAAYFHGRGAAAQNGDAWPEVHLPYVATLVNTIVLVTSGGTMHWAMMRIQKNDRKGFLVGLGLTLLLGGAFLAQQVREYIELFGHGMTLGSSNFGTTFYALTGTHGLHVFG